uniref:RNA polymerase subunit H/Rpb5 C-terminal domain-containing protein n=1 Tax=viral metagenome TaxID=1070528 RepID=A0A6C0LHI9_9ZZZZ
MAQSGFVVQIAKSRENILSQLKTRGFDVNKYEGQSISQVHIMLQNNQLDMLAENPDTGRKAYVKYHLGKTLRGNNIMDYIDDLFTIDSVLTRADDLIVIGRDGANDSMHKALRQIWSQHQYLITVVGLKSLQFNILDHELVPPHRVMSEADGLEIKKKYNISLDSQLPDLSRFSPVSLAIGVRPGEIIEIMRPSKTAISAPFYRICSS